MHEIVANPHTHSAYSDGTWYHTEIARAASAAGIDVVFVTDHNVWVENVEGYYDNVLLLVGEEVHDVYRMPRCNHLLIFGAEDGLAPQAENPQFLVNAVQKRGGLSFLAHPIERSSPLSPELAAIPWDEWTINGYTGIELWNYMSEFKALTQTRLAALFYSLFPDLGIRGPFRHTLRLWDELLSEGRRVVAIGGADAHGNDYSLGPIKRTVFPYQFLFGCVNTHLIIPGTLGRNLEKDRATIYEALREGHCFIGYDGLGPTRGFRFVTRSGSHTAIMGDELRREGALIFQVDVPAPADTRLLRDGKVVARTRTRRLEYTSSLPGIYRVEVHRRFRLRRRAWIFSNPIYIY